jgi:hypothetical protein
MDVLLGSGRFFIPYSHTEFEIKEGCLYLKAQSLISGFGSVSHNLDQ